MLDPTTDGCVRLCDRTSALGVAGMEDGIEQILLRD